MTNEQIAKIMGWDYNFQEKRILQNNRWLDLYSMEGAKLLQAKIVDDEWRITIHAYTTGYFEAEAYHVKKPRLNICVGSNSECQALIALFEKIYGDKK